MKNLINSTGESSTFIYDGKYYTVLPGESVPFTDEIITHYRQHVNGPLVIEGQDNTDPLEKNKYAPAPMSARKEFEEKEKSNPASMLAGMKWADLQKLGSKEDVYQPGTKINRRELESALRGKGYE